VAGFLIPGDWRVTRSIVIDAPPAAVHPFVSDLANWPKWAPFEKGDPDMKITVGTPSQGVGATRSWKSEKMGNGSQEIVRSDPATGIDYRLTIEGMDPFDGAVRYAQAPGGGTEVTWDDHGTVGWPYTLMAPFMEGMMGPQFEQGLRDLKDVVETTSKK
jgi:hypothetical protein